MPTPGPTRLQIQQTEAYLLQGKTKMEIAQLLNVTRMTLDRWIKEECDPQIVKQALEMRSGNWRNKIPKLLKSEIAPEIQPISEEDVKTALRLTGGKLDIIGNLADIQNKTWALYQAAQKEGDSKTAMAALSEIRQQIAIQMKVLEQIYDMEAVAEFQRIVLEVLGSVDEGVRKQVEEKLKDYISDRTTAKSVNGIR